MYTDVSLVYYHFMLMIICKFKHNIVIYTKLITECHVHIINVIKRFIINHVCYLLDITFYFHKYCV